MRITLDELRSIIAEEMTGFLREVDSDGDGTSDSEELDAISRRLEAEEEPDTLEHERPIPPEELHSALSEAIWDLYKYVHGIRPRFLDFSKMTVPELEDMHDRLTKDLEMQEEEEEGWAKDIEDERRDQMQTDLDVANIAAAEAAAEERIMLTPEEGEEFPGQIGMGRGRMMEESFTRGDIKNFFARGLLTEDVT